MGGPGMPPPPPRRGPGMPPPPPRGGYGYRRTYHGGNGMGCGGTIASMLALVVLCIVLVFAFNAVNNRTGYSDNSSTISTIERTKLDSKDPYMKDCIVDELGWINNVSYTSNKLSTFWEQTGVQPYIVLRAYDPNLKNDEMGGEKIVLGRALIELNDLNKMTQLKQDEEGKYILPFGDGVRLEKKNGKFFISVAKKEDEDKTNFSDDDLNSLPL